MKSTPTKTIIGAMRILARDIQTNDGTANMAMREAAERLEILDKAIRETIADNLDLSDGDNCTLIKLKLALEANL